MLAARGNAAAGRCVDATRLTADDLHLRATFPQRLDSTREWLLASEVELACGHKDTALHLARLARENLSRLPEPSSWRRGRVLLATARALAAEGASESAYAYQSADAAFARVVPTTHPYRLAIAREQHVHDLPYVSETPW